MTPLDTYLAAVKERAEKATPGWRAGRPDMQSFTIGGIPYKDMYCDEISDSREAATVYGENSIADSQLFAASRTDVPALLAIIADCREELRKAEEHKTQHAQGCFDMRCWDCRAYAKHEGFRGWDAIAEKWKGRTP